MSDMLLGYCGLYCGGCGVYQATVEGMPKEDDAGRPLLCKGCNSGVTTPWCTDCAIKTCARDKAIRHCSQCAENPCEKMTAFMQDPRYPYHLRVQDDMRSLEALGLAAWCKAMERRYTCETCGQRFDWFAGRCPSCAAA
jgi:hypothetical protein